MRHTVYALILILELLVVVAFASAAWGQEAYVVDLYHRIEIRAETGEVVLSYDRETGLIQVPGRGQLEVYASDRDSGDTAYMHVISSCDGWFIQPPQ